MYSLWCVGRKSDALEVSPVTSILWVLRAIGLRRQSQKLVLIEIRADFTERAPVQVVTWEWFREILCRSRLVRVDWTFLRAARTMLRFPRILT